jgi:hypothetical protein
VRAHVLVRRILERPAAVADACARHAVDPTERASTPQKQPAPNVRLLLHYSPPVSVRRVDAVPQPGRAAARPETRDRGARRSSST